MRGQNNCGFTFSQSIHRNFASGVRLAEPPPEEEEIRVRLVKDRVKETVTRTPEISRQGGKERLSSAHFIHFFVSAIDSDREAKKKT